MIFEYFHFVEKYKNYQNFWKSSRKKRQYWWLISENMLNIHEIQWNCLVVSDDEIFQDLFLANQIVNDISKCHRNLVSMIVIWQQICFSFSNWLWVCFWHFNFYQFDYDLFNAMMAHHIKIKSWLIHNWDHQSSDIISLGMIKLSIDVNHNMINISIWFIY